MKYPILPANKLHRVILIAVIMLLPYTVYNYVTRGDSAPVTTEGDADADS